MRLSLPLALWVVMLVTASAAAHGRVFVNAGGGAPVHRITVVPSAVVVAPDFVAVSAFHGVPHAALVSTPPRVIRPGTPPHRATKARRAQGDPGGTYRFDTSALNGNRTPAHTV